VPLIRPFPGLRPAPGRAADVLAPPYDVLNTEEARWRTAGRPLSFLHVSKPEIDLPAGTDLYDLMVYRKAAENFARMRAQGILVEDPGPCYYAYRLSVGEHAQTGLVAVASVAAYECNRIRRHEHTRPDKETDRARHIEALNAQTGPALLVYHSEPAVDGLLEEVTATAPEVDVTADDGVRHQLWVINEGARITALSAVFENLSALYIADGHHRSAAASRVAKTFKYANPAHTGDERYNYFLAVIFPHHALRILDYNRVVRDLNGLTPEALLARLEASFHVEPAAFAVKPERCGVFGMYLVGRWYHLVIRPERIPSGDPVARIDTALLSHYLIEPVLGIADLRRDERIDFVSGIHGLEALEARVQSSEMAVAFALFPTRMEDLMAAADAGQVMPPKSTWFEPKLADGLVSHLIKQ
jgi:Uncharacterized conserved protein